MPTTCSIVRCTNRSDKHKTSFFRLPKVVTGQGEEAEKKSERKRRLWLAAINRSDLKSLDNVRVCSEHFITGKPHPWDETSPDWVPSLKLGYNLGASATKVTDRHDRLRKRKETKTKTEAVMSLLQLSDSFAVDAQEECDDILPLPGQESNPDEEFSDAAKLEIAQAEIVVLREGYHKMKDQNECLRSTVLKMKAHNPEDFKDDDKVKYYTGLKSYLSLMSLFILIAPVMTENRKSSLSKFQKLVLTLMRLRLNLPITDLSFRFGVSRTTISKTFQDTLNILFDLLQPFVRWPSREELTDSMPMVFRKQFGCKVTCIIDCFEIFIDRPSNMMARAQTWSSYKHHNTAKYLIAISPQGTVSYISEGWGGRVSDKHLTANCNFTDHLIHGDVILADRGFDIRELVALVGAEVLFPAFRKGKDQLSASEVESTRKIANVRIHVERVIGSVRQKYAILSGTCPIDYVITKPGDDHPILDKIVFVCCALTNLSPSVVSLE